MHGMVRYWRGGFEVCEEGEEEEGSVDAYSAREGQGEPPGPSSRQARVERSRRLIGGCMVCRSGVAVLRVPQP